MPDPSPGIQMDGVRWRGAGIVSGRAELRTRLTWTGTQYASATDTRVTLLGYDFRNRRISMDGEIDVFEQYTLENLDRETQT